MTPGRRWAAVLLLALIVFCERFAWYGARPDLISGLYQELSFSSAERSVFVEADRWFGLGGTLVAGVAATAAGPWGVLLVGSLVMAGGYAALMVGPSDVYVAAAHAVGFGAGVTRPAVFAAVIVVFARPHEALRLASCCALWGAMNLAGFLAFLPRAFGSYGPTGDWVFGTAAALCGAGAGLSVLLVLGTLAAAPTQEQRAAEPTAHWDRPVFVAACALLAAAAVPWGATMSIYSPLWGSLMVTTPAPLSFEHWMSVNPAFVVWGTWLAAAVFALTALLGKNLNGVRVVGVGMLLLAFGAMAVSFEAVRGNGVVLLGAIALLSMGEVLAGAGLLARIGGGLHWRAVTGVLALWMVAISLVRLSIDTWFHPAAADGFSFRVPQVGAAVAVVLGLALLVLGGRIRRALYLPDRPDEGARSALPI
ncbi:MAG: hypothetical protein GY898_28970 [Proteobacteria bacterium]|nr:hypothetical protein [Pseudomonadota bacterium]